MRKLKIVTIGGGSSYTPELVEGLIKRHNELPVTDLYLVDVEEGKEKLKIVGDLAKRMVEEAEVDINIHLSLNRKESLKDADFIITQFRVGFLDARIRDEEIPLRYNSIGQETTGAGGMANALRTIPVILEIAEEIEEVAPDTWLINFSNPSGMVTEAVLKYTNAKTIGLCNVPIIMHKMCSEILNVDDEEIKMDFVGLNHLVWGRKVWHQGENKVEEVLDVLLKDEIKDVKNMPNYGWDKELLESLKMLPCPYHRYYYMSDKMHQEEIEAKNKNGTRGNIVKEIEKELFNIYENKNLRHKPKQLEERGGQYYSDAACDLINAIYNDKGTIHYVNIKNEGTISCLPDDSVIERTCYVGKEGAIPLNVEELDSHVKGLLQVVNEYESLAIKAAVEGDYNSAYLALLTHPLVKSSLVKPLLDDILNENKKYLPQFK